MIVNRTNADRIAFMYSPDTDNWLGKPITLFTDMVSFQGKTMQALRVKPPKPNAQQPATNGSPAAPRRMSATGQHVVEQRGNYGLSRMQAPVNTSVPPGEPDRDELPDDQEIPF